MDLYDRGQLAFIDDPESQLGNCSVWTRTWTRSDGPAPLLTLRMTRKCAGFYETREIQRPDAWCLFFLICKAMERGRARKMIPLVKDFLHIELWIAGEPGRMPLVKYFLHINLWIAGDPGLMPLVKYFLHIELWIVGESEPCYLWQALYRSSHETREHRRYRTPDALWRPYFLLLLNAVPLLVPLLLLFFVLFVLINTIGVSHPAVFLWSGIVIVSLHVSFSFRWFGPETIEHD